MSDIGQIDDRARSHQRLIFEAEKEASKKVESARKRSNEVVQEEEIRLNNIKDEYQKQTQTEAIRGEAALENAKTKSYENLRQTQMQFAKEKQRVSLEGRQETDRLNNHYKSQAYTEELEGEKKLSEVRHKNFEAQEYERRKTETLDTSYRGTQRARLAQLKDEQDRNYAKLAEEARARYEVAKMNSDDGILASDEKFSKQVEDHLATQRQNLASINSRTSGLLEKIKQDQTRSLAAYSERGQDPFYQPISIGAQVKEHDDHFEIFAPVPAHEQKGLAVTVQGQNLVISGHRTHDESVNTEDGTVQTSSSYQAFTESVPLTFPVEARLLSREATPDGVTFRVPKKQFYAPQYQAKSRTPELDKLKIDGPPKFPHNLPKHADTMTPAEVSQDDLTDKLAKRSIT